MNQDFHQGYDVQTDNVLKDSFIHHIPTEYLL